MTTNVLQRWTSVGRPIEDVLICENEDVYHARRSEHLSSHALADFRRCPFLFRKQELGLILEEDRPAYLIGRAAHVLILEGRAAYEERFAFRGPINPKTGNPYGANTKAFAEWEELQGKPVLSDSQAALVDQMGLAVRDHAEARALLAEGWPERVARAEWRGVACQARFDWFHPERGIVDLKTADKLDWFEADARLYGYAHQMAFYRAVLSQAADLKAPMPVHIVAVEKREPFRVGVWKLSDQVLSVAERDNAAAIARLKQSRSADVWPTGYEDIRTFDTI